MSGAVRPRELLRPPPHRGPLLAAAAVVLALGVVLLEFRLAAKLDTAPHALVLLAVGGLTYWLGVQAPLEDGRPPAYQSVLLLTALPLLLVGFARVAQLLGAQWLGLGVLTAGAVLVAGLALWPALERNSATCLLVAAILAGCALLGFWRLVFDTTAVTPYRWLLLALSVGCVLGSLSLREPAPRHGQQLANAAGLATAAIGAFSLAGSVIALDGTSSVMPGFWEAVLLFAGCGLLAFAALDRAPGPAYVGVANLGLFVAAVAPSPQRTLYWWPLLLLALGVIGMAAGLRPRRPLPPEPPAYRSGEAPLAARADGDEPAVHVRDEA